MKKNRFGILLAHIRVDHGEVMKDMAKKLNISMSYLSTMETGHRHIPSYMIPRLKELYNLDDSTVNKLLVERLKINGRIGFELLPGTTDNQVDLGLMISKLCLGLSQEQVSQLKDLLDTFEKQNEDLNLYPRHVQIL